MFLVEIILLKGFLMFKRKIITYRCDLSSWKDILKDEPCFILGNGPSLIDHNLNKLNNFFTIGVNRIIKVYCPTIIFWQDYNVLRDTSGPNYYPNFTTKKQDWSENANILLEPMNTGGNAIVLASILGCNPIILLGCDCCFRDSKTNFYGKNYDYLGHEKELCIKYLKKIHQFCDKDIINCSENSLWFKSDYDQTIISLMPKEKSQSYFYKKLIKKN